MCQLKFIYTISKDKSASLWQKDTYSEQILSLFEDTKAILRDLSVRLRGSSVFNSFVTLNSIKKYYFLAHPSLDSPNYRLISKKEKELGNLQNKEHHGVR